MVTDKAFKFHVCIPSGKIFSLVSMSRSYAKVKVKYQGMTFEKKLKNIGPNF